MYIKCFLVLSINICNQIEKRSNLEKEKFNIYYYAHKYNKYKYENFSLYFSNKLLIIIINILIYAIFFLLTYFIL